MMQMTTKLSTHDGDDHHLCHLCFDGHLPRETELASFLFLQVTQVFYWLDASTDV